MDIGLVNKILAEPKHDEGLCVEQQSARLREKCAEFLARKADGLMGKEGHKHALEVWSKCEHNRTIGRAINFLADEEKLKELLTPEPPPGATPTCGDGEK